MGRLVDPLTMERGSPGSGEYCHGRAREIPSPEAICLCAMVLVELTEVALEVARDEGGAPAVVYSFQVGYHLGDTEPVVLRMRQPHEKDVLLGDKVGYKGETSWHHCFAHSDCLFGLAEGSTDRCQLLI